MKRLWCHVFHLHRYWIVRGRPGYRTERLVTVTCCRCGLTWPFSVSIIADPPPGKTPR